MKKIKTITTIIFVVLMTISFVGCEDTPTQDEKERAYTESLMSQASATVGQPDITNFYEKKLAKEIFEKRDNSELICYVYSQNLDGKYIYIGKSMGYGLPYSTQYTAPTVDIDGYETQVFTKHQADPNGLYTADGLSATWLMMIDEKNGSTYIMYCEPTIVVTEQKMPKRLIVDWSIEGIDY